ncbi:MAG: sulfatase-like hydrolase/transferase [Planctomycetes bacterium]|nr:sulfatase-like hydrolase/transferase [Planctomycetota bacterium]
MTLFAALRYKALVAGSLTLSACGSPEPPTSSKAELADAMRPHIVLVIADDLGFGDLARAGRPEHIPALLELAERGVRLEQFHTFPLCTPSRAALMTGRSPLRDGLAWSPLRPWSELGLDPARETLPEVLRAAGYHTALLGKWHLGHTFARHHPNNHGFDHFYGFLTGAVDYFSHESRDGGRDWQRNGTTVQESGYVTRLLSHEAERLIAEHDFAQPLFLMLSYSAPHRPMQAPPETLAKMAEMPKAADRVYTSMLAELDQGIERVRSALELAGVTSNTLWVFLSDNGAALQLGGSNGELKGGKSAVTQGGLRVPAFVHWPGQIEGGRSSASFQVMQDIAPTLASFAGAHFTQAIDGRDLHAEWLGQKSANYEVPATAFVAHNEQRGQMALIYWPWKLIRRIDRAGGNVREQLFRIDEDPTESTNLIRENEGRAQELRALLAEWVALDPQGLGLEKLPNWEGSAPETWKAPAAWAEAIR